MGKYSIQFYNTLEQGSNASDNTTKNLQELTYKDHLYPYTEGVEATIESDNYKVTWASFCLHKRVYNAGKLELTFDISVEGSTLNIDKANTIYNQFKGYKSLRMQDNTVSDHLVVTNTVDLLTHYVIFNCKRIVTNARYSIVVTAYSPDKLLTIDKFNRAFTGKKFYADMVSGYLNTSSSFLSANSNPNLVAYKNCGLSLTQNLQNLLYKQTKKDENGKDVTEEYEALLPYTVQYNESIWDFLVRIASRNGEFLFYENGNVHVGLPKTDAASVVTLLPTHAGYVNTSSQLYFDIMEEEACSYFQDASTLFDNDYLDSQRSVETTNVSNANDLYNSECIISPEINELVTKTDFSTIDDYVQHIKFVFDSVGTFFQETSILDAIVSVGVSAFNSYHSGGIFVNSDNDKFNNYYFPESNAKNDNPVDALYAEKKKEGEEAFYLFASSLRLLNNQFYHAVCEDSEYSRKNMLSFQFSEYVNVPLGSTVCYNNANYTVWSVNMEHGICVVKVIPVLKLSKTAAGMVLATKITLDTDLSMPIIDRKKRIAKATSQRAVVVDNYDPLKLGRVRVRYPWQPVASGATSDTYAGTKYNDISPWLRIVLPMASDGAGFMFMPNKGDEVMVDYEDGNIDRPYVCGSMYSINHQPGYHASTQLCGKTKSICTNNGHHLAFTDKPGDMRMLARMIPLWSQLSKFGMWNGKDMDSELGRHTTGGFEIADYWGIYSISGNTENRSVSIESPVGKVSVSALTGISIEAPLGDVSIVGKNVKIEARNNLSIESGTNITNSLADVGETFDSWWDDKTRREKGMGIATSLAGSVIDLTKGTLGLDFKFIRCMLEAVLKPIGGGLALKSNRYITISSGDGEASYTGDCLGYKIGKYDDKKTRAAIDAYSAEKGTLSYVVSRYHEILNLRNNINNRIRQILEILNRLDGIEIQCGDDHLILCDTQNVKSCFNEMQNAIEENSLKFRVFDGDGNEMEGITESYRAIHYVWVRVDTVSQDILERIGNTDYYSTIRRNLPNYKDVVLKSISDGQVIADEFPLITDNEIKQMLYKIAANNFSQFVNFAADAPNRFDDETLKEKIKVPKDSDLLKFGKSVGNKVITAIGLKGTWEEWAWLQQTKGGVIISNADGKSYTFKDGQYKPYTSEPLIRSLIKDLTTFNI